MQDKIEKIIYNWVEKNFGTSEAEDPSWDIKALAEELNKHFHELYWQQELEYLKEDVENYIDGLDLYGKRDLFGGLDTHEWKLTEQQMYNVADGIRNSEWYCSINPEDMEWYIKREVEIDKEKGVKPRTAQMTKEELNTYIDLLERGGEEAEKYLERIKQNKGE